MSLKNSSKRILFKLPKPAIDSFYTIYDRVRYPDLTEKRVSFGNLNADKTVYIIRPRTDGIEGLMSLFQNVVKQINYAEKNSYIPVVDFKNYKTQYTDNKQHIKNVWEYYFEQPSYISLEEAYNSKNVVLSGLSGLRKSDSFLDQKMDKESIKKARLFVKEHIRLTNTTTSYVNKEMNSFYPERTLGLYLRGTDYTKLRPAGHPVQPTAEQAIKVAEQMMKKNNLENVFLVTEDDDIYRAVKERFHERLRIVSYDAFIEDYKGDVYLSQDEKMISQLAYTPYQRGLNYLAKLIILSKCKCFVGGNTCGSWAANTFSEGYDDSYIFELGVY